MSTKNNSKTILGVVSGILLGVLIMIGVQWYFTNGSASTEISQSKSHEISGVLLFIESTPTSPYTTIGTINADDLSAIADSVGVGKHKKVLDVISSVVKTGRENLDFQEKIKVFVKRAQEKYNSDAQGLIFVGDLRSATVIKFNQ